MAVSDYSTTPADNTLLNGLTVTDATLADALDNIIRQLMADTKAAYDETARLSGATFTGPVAATGATFTGPVAATGATFTGGIAAPSVDIGGYAASHVLLREIEITKGVDAPVAAINEAIPVAFKAVHIEFEEFEPVTSGSALIMRIGAAGAGGGFLATSSYVDQFISFSNTTVTPLASARNHWPLTSGGSTASEANRAFGNCRLRGFNTASGLAKGETFSGGVTPSGNNYGLDLRLRNSTTGNYNAVQFLADSGNIANLKIKIYGVL